MVSRPRLRRVLASLASRCSVRLSRSVAVGVLAVRASAARSLGLFCGARLVGARIFSDGRTLNQQKSAEGILGDHYHAWQMIMRGPFPRFFSILRWKIFGIKVLC